MNQYHISKQDYGVRLGWAKYDTQFEFNVIVNDMQEVLKHVCVENTPDDRVYIKTSCGTHGFRVNLV